MWVQLLEGPPPKYWEGQKTVQISARFFTTFDFDREYLRLRKGSGPDLAGGGPGAQP